MSNRPARTSHLSGLVAGALPGAALGAAALVAGLVRRDKPLHPVGHHAVGMLSVTAPAPDLGVDVLARSGGRPVEARWSRAMGLPRGWGDIEGMALRFPDGADDGSAADLLFAGTGSGAWSRYLLVPTRPGRFGRLTTLLPVRAADRAVTFMLVPDEEAAGELPPSAYTLHVARAAGPWELLGRLEVEWSADDTTERFDPITNKLAGLEQYAVVTALREPAYVAARAVTSAGRAGRRARAAALRAGRRAPAGNP